MPAETCYGCGLELKHFDNGGPTCLRCLAEESHDFDAEPGVKFNRHGERIDGEAVTERSHKLDVSNYLHVIWDRDQALLDLITKVKLFHVIDAKGVQFPEGVPTLQVFDDDFPVPNESNWDQIWDILPDLIEQRCGELAEKVVATSQELGDKFDVSIQDTRRLMARAVESVQIMEMVDYLREPEGACVTISCDNPSPELSNLDVPNNVIHVTDEGTGWRPRKFGGDTLLAALREAVAWRKNPKGTP